MLAFVVIALLLVVCLALAREGEPRTRVHHAEPDGRRFEFTAGVSEGPVLRAPEVASPAAEEQRGGEHAVASPRGSSGSGAGPSPSTPGSSFDAYASSPPPFETSIDVITTCILPFLD